MNKEIVISVYDKDLSWVDTINDDTKITIYRKGENPKSKYNEILIEPNIGRDVHTFFNHIINRYDDLTDITFFVQDYPFDHWGNLVDVVNDLNLISTYSINFGGYYGFHNNTLGTAWTLEGSTHLGNGMVLKCNSSGSPQHTHEDLNLNYYWDLFFLSSNPLNYEFIPGGHFTITKEQIRLRPIEFYKKILTFLETEQISPWIIERFECYIFNKNFKIKE